MVFRLVSSELNTNTRVERRKKSLVLPGDANGRPISLRIAASSGRAFVSTIPQHLRAAWDHEVDVIILLVHLNNPLDIGLVGKGELEGKLAFGLAVAESVHSLGALNVLKPQRVERRCLSEKTLRKNLYTRQVDVNVGWTAE